jgi:hypothetical protein
VSFLTHLYFKLLYIFKNCTIVFSFFIFFLFRINTILNPKCGHISNCCLPKTFYNLQMNPLNFCLHFYLSEYQVKYLSELLIQFAILPSVHICLSFPLSICFHFFLLSLICLSSCFFTLLHIFVSLCVFLVLQ